MALNTVTLLSLLQSLAESTGEFIEFSTTTNITTNNSVISTTLKEYDESEDDHFGGAGTEWWLYIDGTNNSDILRRTTDYATATGTLTVAGAALAAEDGAVTCRLFRYNRTNLKNAIVEACKEIYPALYKNLDDRTLITGNIIPDASFEEWTSSSASKFILGSNATLAQTTAGGYTRGQQGSTSMRVTVSTANGYAYLNTDTYPRLLDLMGRTVNFYCWLTPEVTADASIEIVTTQADGTSQTLTSTTSCPAGKWTQLKLENQTLNDDLATLDINFKVATDTKFAYFDDAYLNGMGLTEYLLPGGFVKGHLSGVQVMAASDSDDLNPFITTNAVKEYPPEIVSDGSNIYLRLPHFPSENRVRLLGFQPLETLSADSDTITLDDHRVPLLIARARMIFWQREAVPISTEDKGRYEYEYSKAERDYRRLLKLRMPLPAEMV